MAQARGKLNPIFPDSFYIPLQSFPVFYITESDYGLSFYAETFHTVEDAQDAISRLYDALEDCTGSGYSIRCAIAELEDQLSEHLMAQS